MQSSTPLVSALVTTFNHEAFIADAIESLLDQTYPKMEVIVVDDGSSDRTFDRACKYQSRGVRVLPGPRKGPSCAMNLAMSQASGEIFLLQSGDDLSLPIRADVQVRALSNADLHAGLPTLIDSRGSILPDASFPAFFRCGFPNMEALFKNLYEEGNLFCASSVALKRSVWENLGGFHPGLLQLQDYEYWLRAVSDGCTFASEPERLTYYRIHESNLSNPQNDIRMHRELGAIFRLLLPNIPITFVNEILYGGPFDGLPTKDIERDILVALLFLRHPIETVRQIGVDAMIDCLGNPSTATKLDQQFGVSFRTIFDLFLRH